jgi:hypothetical protein
MKDPKPSKERQAEYNKARIEFMNKYPYGHPDQNRGYQKLITLFPDVFSKWFASIPPEYRDGQEAYEEALEEFNEKFPWGHPNRKTEDEKLRARFPKFAKDLLRIPTYDDDPHFHITLGEGRWNAVGKVKNSVTEDWLEDSYGIRVKTFKILEFVFRQCMMQNFINGQNGGYKYKGESLAEDLFSKSMSDKNWLLKAETFIFDREQKTGLEYGFESKEISIFSDIEKIAKVISAIKNAIEYTKGLSRTACPVPMLPRHEAEIMETINKWLKELEPLNKGTPSFLNYDWKKATLLVKPEAHPFFSDFIILTYACWEKYFRLIMLDEIAQKNGRSRSGNKKTLSEKSFSRRINKFINEKLKNDLGRQPFGHLKIWSETTSFPVKLSFDMIDAKFYDTCFSGEGITGILKQNNSSVFKRKMNLPFSLGLLTDDRIRFILDGAISD